MVVAITTTSSSLQPVEFGGELGDHPFPDVRVTDALSTFRGDQYGLLVVDEEHHLPAPTDRQIPEKTIAPYRLGLTTTDERETYDEEYGLYRNYVDSHAFDLWTEEGYAAFRKRTSYDPEGRRALIAKQRAEWITRTAEKKLDTLIKRHHDDRAIIFTANNDFAYDISREFIVPCIAHQTRTDERTEILDRFRTGEYSMLVTS